MNKRIEQKGAFKMVRSALRTDMGDLNSPPIPSRNNVDEGEEGNCRLLDDDLPTPPETNKSSSRRSSSVSHSQSTENSIWNDSHVHHESPSSKKKQNADVGDVKPPPPIPVRDNNIDGGEERNSRIDDMSREKSSTRKSSSSHSRPTQRRPKNDAPVRGHVSPSFKKKPAKANNASKLAWENKIKELNEMKKMEADVGTIYRPSLYSYDDLLRRPCTLSHGKRSPASQNFFAAVSKASRQASTSSRKVLVLGSMHGELAKGVSLHKAIQATCEKCGLAPGDLIRKSALFWPGADIVAETPSDAGRVPEDVVTTAVGLTGEAAVGLAGEAAPWLGDVAAVAAIGGVGIVASVAKKVMEQRQLKKGVKKQLRKLNEKEGIQILCFDGKCFSVRGARLEYLEWVEKLEASSIFQTYRLSDSSVIDHAVARGGSWLDLRARALHEYRDVSALTLKLMRYRKGSVQEVGQQIMKSPIMAIKLMDVTRLAGRFPTIAKAKDIFWVETCEID